MAKSKRNKNAHYVLRRGLKPDIYDTYDEALKNKFPWDHRPLIRAFRTREEAQYYYEHGEVMPPELNKSELKQKPLWTDEDEQNPKLTG